MINYLKIPLQLKCLRTFCLLIYRWIYFSTFLFYLISINDVSTLAAVYKLTPCSSATTLYYNFPILSCNLKTFSCHLISFHFSVSFLLYTYFSSFTPAHRLPFYFLLSTTHCFLIANIMLSTLFKLCHQTQRKS